MIQHTQPSSELVIFVTHIEPDDVYLKIWGQMDKHTAGEVERQIYSLVEQFNQGYGCPTKANRLVVGTLCCARFQADGYYRATILNIRSDGMIVVQFIDYGNIEILHPNEIRLLENISGSEHLRAFPPMAAEFTLVNVLPINGIWENRTIETIRRNLCYNEYRAVVYMINNRCMIKLWYNNEDFSKLLVKERMALSATIKDMIRPKHVLQPHIPAYQQQNKGNMNNFATMTMMQNSNINHNTNMEGIVHKTFSPSMNQHKLTVQPSPPSPVQEALVFKSRVLDVGSEHEVLISFVEDGPQKFSVQVQSTKVVLTHLMNEINSHPKQPLQEPPLPGSVCLGRYTGDGVLCRAVVMSVMEHKCKLYYVDFGHTEILPYTHIFQLPPKYINPKVLSIRFTLSGLKELNITKEMKEYFKKLVYRRLLVLHVRPPEGPPLIQYGDLYDNGINIKDMLKKAFPSPTATIPITYSYPQLRQLSKDVQEVVHVCHVESCKKFFVLLDSGLKPLKSIMIAVAQYANTAPALSIKQLKVGLPCAALYDSQWHRAQILSIIEDKIKVVYVDYGNEEILPIISLRTIHDDLVTKLPAQAIKCALNGYEVLSSDEEVSNHFEKLTLDKDFYMKVVAAQPNGLLVDLFEFDTMRSIHPQLLNNLFCDKSENSTISSRNEEIQHSIKTMSDSQSEDKDKHNKKSNTDTWNHNRNTKSFQGNKSNTWKDEWSQEKQHDNKRERTNTYSHRDNSQNDRFTKEEVVNNRPGRDKSYNKYDKSEVNASNRRGTPRGGGNRFNVNERKHNRNNSIDKAYSDKDSDSSSRSSVKRGKGGINRDSFNSQGISGRLQTANWNDKKPAMTHRSNNKNWKLNGDYNMSNNKFVDKENNTSSVLCDQINTNESGKDTSGANKEQQNNVAINKKSKFFSMNITLGVTKDCKLVFVENPSKFFVQLNSDLLEFNTIMENIAATYENGGETMQRSEIQCNTCCIAQYSEDLKWYRAIIKSVEENSATMEFVDYGNTDPVDFTKIKVIREEFLKLPMQAIHCKLLGLTNTSSKENELAILLEKVENSLEVEFVAEENGVYEVLLREVINGIPNTNYVNEEFCAAADLKKAKEAIISKKASKGTTKKIQVSSDYASFDSKWQTTLYKPGSKHDVFVTWFVNPNKFYCQLLTKETEFKAMMNEIQKMYVDKEPITHKLQAGSPIIAIYSEDGALYRAEVVSTNAQMDAYVVQYIDFGNCATVNQRNIYPVEKKFMQLPKLAVHCSLRNILSNDNSSLSELDSDAFDNCFNADKYQCIFHNFSDNQYSISLTHNGKDVGEMLIQKNLATFATRTLTETVDEMKILSDVERVDISLLSGQTLKMRISHVESTSRFHIQPPSASRYENIINKYIIDRNTEALALPGELAVMQNQAFECSMQNVPTSSDADKQLKELEGKEVLIYVEEVNNGRLLVKLYDLLGNGIINTKEDRKISLICPMPILSSTHKVFVPYAEHSASIWLQRHADMDIETKLVEDLQHYYSESGQRLKPEVDLLCAAKCSDGQWYRGKIINYTETTVYVNCIDYGNTEEVVLESIMVLEPQFYEPYQLAVNVSLSITLSGTEAEQVNVLQTHLINKELTAVFYNVHKKWIVDLTENGEKLNDKFRSLNLVKEEQTAPELSNQTLEASPIGKFDVCVSHVDSPSQFWLLRVDEMDSLNEKQRQLQLDVVDFLTIDCIPEEGTLCVAVYSIDNLWYRAEVLDADEDITTVRFIDYGNTDVINNKAGNIRQIPDAWKNLERFAMKCRLDVIPVDTEDWDESTCERFENLITPAETLQALIIADTMPKRVELFINDKSVSEKLVEEKHAIIINTEQEPVDEIVDLELDPHSAFVSHINSPNEFWIQEEKSVANLEVMADRFMVADMFTKIDDAKEGLLCVAKYPEDEQWYRAHIISQDDNGTQVIYIDYGNSAVSTEIRAIPEDLADIPPLSRKCCLELPPHVKEWSKQACEEFIKLAADGATIFLLDVLKEQEISLVKLTLNGRNIADILANMCEQHLPVIEERLPPLGEENSPNVVVSHINSPIEFWIQTESNINELEVMADRLRDAESFLALNNLDIGTICAAKYLEDGYWYRAKIVASCEKDLTEVLYMDYGNSAITNELRMLPEDIVNIPTLSKRCALEKPSNVTWSEKACDKFKELAAEGATMFQFEIIDEDDPVHIRLNLNGANVVDLLLAECENILEIEKVTKTEVGDITFNTMKQPETVFHGDHRLINNDKETSNLNEEAQQKSIFNETSNLDTNSLDYINQKEKLEFDEMFNQSFEYSNVNEKYEHGKEQKYTTNFNEIKKNLDERSGIALECSSETKEISEEINITVKTNKDLDINDETISISAATPQLITYCLEEPPPIVTELSVDEIVGNMIRNAIEDLESRKIDDTNLLIANKTQLQNVVQTDANEQQESLSQIPSIDMNVLLDTQGLEIVNAIRDLTEDLDSKKTISTTNELQPQICLTDQDVMQEYTNQDKNQKVHSELQSEINGLSKSQVLKMMCLPIQQTNLEQIQKQSPTKDKNNDLEFQSEITNTDDNSNSSESICTVKEAKSLAIIKTDSTQQYSYSRRWSEDEKVSRCISRSESPDSEAKCPVAPKTSHSEKLVTDTVNPFVQSIPDSVHEDDEIHTASVENNIPKYMI